MTHISLVIKDHIDYIKYIEQKSKCTIKQRSCYLKRFSDFVGPDMNIEEVDNNTIERWVIHLKKDNPNISGRSVNTAVSHIKSFTRWCFEKRSLDTGVNLQAMPRLAESDPEHRYCTRRDVERAVRYATKRGNFRRAMIVQLLFDSCMRLSELTNLKRTDISGREITYIGKGNRKCRSVISKGTADMLHAWLASHDGIYVFQSPVSKYRPMAVETVRTHVSSAFLAIGIEGMRPHDMRHSGATDLELRGAPIQFISRILNHSKLATTQIYMHGDEANLLQNFDTYRGAMRVDKSFMVC